MKLRILAVGKVRESWLQAGIDEYTKRLGRYVTVEICEVPDAPDHWPRERALEKEGEGLLRLIRPREYVVLCDLWGAAYDSVALAEKMDQWMEAGGAAITWVIAGSNGFDPRLLERAQERARLSPLTFPHQLTRLILLEQCFRSFKILRGEPYHK